MEAQGSRITMGMDEIGKLEEAAEALGKRLRERTPAVTTLPLEGIEEPETFQGYRIVATTVGERVPWDTMVTVLGNLHGQETKNLRSCT